MILDNEGMYYTLEPNKGRKNQYIEDFEVANFDPKGENYQSANSSL